VTEHLQARLRREGISDPAVVTPALVRARDGRTFMSTLPASTGACSTSSRKASSFDRVQEHAHAYEWAAASEIPGAGVDLAPDRLHDTLPGFHHTPRYLAELDDAIRLDAQGRFAAAKIEVAFVRARKNAGTAAHGPHGKRQGPGARGADNDPKVNNVMVHAARGRPCASRP